MPATIATVERWLTGALTAERLDQFLAALHAIRAEVRPGATAGALD